MDTKELRRKRAELITQARQIIDAAEAEKRDLTAEDHKKYDDIMSEVDNLGASIERVEKQEKLEAELNASTTEPNKPDPGGGPEDRSKKEMDIFRRWLISGPDVLTVEERALQVDVDVQGGYLVPPQEFITKLIQAVDDEVFIRQLATGQRITKSDSMGAPSLDADPADADWTTELQTGSEDSTMALGKRELTPHPLAKRIKVSNKLLRISAIPVEDLVRQRLAYKVAIPQEKAYLTGSGAGQPLGVFTASAQGISTSRDVSTGNTATSIQFDGLFEAKYTLKGQYWKNAVWFFHRDALKQVAKLKDGDGQYIWEPAVQSGQPDRLLGFPFKMSEYAPNTFTTGLYAGILGDFRHYWYVDSLDMTIQRLVELYAETNQTGFIIRYEGDGMPVLEEAFVRVKLA